jgi:Kdo2-lipid IVA lauroyltransferase/acyltransferase
MKIIHGIEYAGVRLLALPLQLLPHQAAVSLGARLGRAANNVWISRHQVVIKNLEIAFGDSLTAVRREELARDIFANLGRTLAELCRFPKLTRENILSMVTAEGTESFQEALDYGKGAILVGSHFGNWELGGAYINALGFPVDFLIRGQHNRLVDDYLTNLRKGCGVGVIHSDRGGMKDVVRALKNNRQVAIVSDQHAGSNGILIKFFGQLVSVPRAPATLAVKFGCPLISGHTLRNPDNTHHCIFHKPLYPNPETEPNAEILRLTKAYTGRFEDMIRSHPDHWLWTHRRFKPLPGTEQQEGIYVE